MQGHPDSVFGATKGVQGPPCQRAGYPRKILFSLFFLLFAIGEKKKKKKTSIS
jgi:hypothetical protein